MWTESCSKICVQLFHWLFHNKKTSFHNIWIMIKAAYSDIIKTCVNIMFLCSHYNCLTSQLIIETYANIRLLRGRGLLC